MKKTKGKIHFFDCTIYNSFHRLWLSFTVECGISIERQCCGQKMKNVTNSFEDVTCGNCIRLHFNRRK